MKQLVVLRKKVVLQKDTKCVLAYSEFRKKVRNLISKAGGGIAVNFYYDKEKGRYYANCSDGVTIIGNPSSLKVSVRWGDRHASVANL